MAYGSHKITIYEVPGKQFIISFGTKKQAEMTQEYLRQLKDQYPDGKELGTFDRKELKKFFDKNKRHVWVGDDQMVVS